MTSVSLPAPQHQWPSSPQLHPHHAYGYSQCSVSRPAPLANPPFTFPQSQNLASAPSVSMTTVRHSMALPSFSFPQAPESASPELSPTAPATATATATVASQQPRGNHRTCASEIVGGAEAAQADVQANADSESKTALSPPTPSLLPEPSPGFSSHPPPGRRRHRHQRSSAVSSVDLNAVAKAFPPTAAAAAAAGGSAPTTPADVRQLHNLNGEAVQSPSKTFPSTSPRSLPPPSPASPGDSKLAPSPVSSTAATLPAGNSPLATASSVATSSTTLQPPYTPTECSSPHLETSQNASVRPKTAGAMVGSTEKGGPNLTGKGKHKRPLSFSISTSKSATQSDSTTDVPDVPPLPKAVKETITTLNDSFGKRGKRDKPSDSVQDTKLPEESNQPDPEDKPGKKKKVRSWAGMLTRKARKRGRKKPRARKTPTPPPILSRTNSEVGSTSGVDFDKDNTVVIRSLNLMDAPPHASQQASADDRPSLETSWKPKSFYEQGAESGIFSPVIDLDAALGPFNTPDMASETPQASGFSIATKRMYSGGRRGQFIGPEMRYHRRTESAPVMPPFDRPSSGAACLSGMAAMANPDVFDEEEEDAFLAGNDSSAADDTASERDNDDGDSETGLGIQVVDSASNPSATEAAPAASRSSLSSPRTIVADYSPTLDAATTLDTESLVAHRDATSNVKDTPPWPTAETRPATSPDFGVSKGVFASENAHSEVSRLATASSVATSRQTFGSNYDGGLSGDDMHGSTDDVPSLTSTTSTATGTTPPVSSNSPQAPGDQPRHSTSAGVRSRSRHLSSTSKRSSLVSLTKLVGASLGEKSKLSYEEKAPESNPMKTKRKAHRFSRLMHFWKDKEKAQPKRSSPE